MPAQASQLARREGPQRDRAEEAGLDAPGARLLDGAARHPRCRAVGDDDVLGVVHALGRESGFLAGDFRVLVLEGQVAPLQDLGLQVDRLDDPRRAPGGAC